jgi:hypothetical protein
MSPDDSSTRGQLIGETKPSETRNGERIAKLEPLASAEGHRRVLARSSRAA